MLYKQLLIVILLVFTLISCKKQSGLKEALAPTLDVKNAAPNDIIDKKHDVLIAKEIEYRLDEDTLNCIIRTNLYDKYMIAFPISKSIRLKKHIYKLNNADDVANSLGNHFENFFYDCRFNKELDLAKFYFEASKPDTFMHRFIDMCVLSDYKIINLNN